MVIIPLKSALRHVCGEVSCDNRAKTAYCGYHVCHVYVHERNAVSLQSVHAIMQTWPDVTDHIERVLDNIGFAFGSLNFTPAPFQSYV